MKSVSKQTIVDCPKCGAELPLTEAILEPLRIELRKHYSEEYEKKLQEVKDSIEAEARRQVEENSAVTIKDLREQIQELKDKLQKANETELESRKEGGGLESKQEESLPELTRKIEEQIKELKDELEVVSRKWSKIKSAYPTRIEKQNK